MEKTNNLIQEWYKNSNEKIKTKYVPNILPVTRENQVIKLLQHIMKTYLIIIRMN